MVQGGISLPEQRYWQCAVDARDSDEAAAEVESQLETLPDQTQRHEVTTGSSRSASTAVQQYAYMHEQFRQKTCATQGPSFPDDRRRLP